LACWVMPAPYMLVRYSNQLAVMCHVVCLAIPYLKDANSKPNPLYRV
jgi:hypothetical protein